MPYYKTSDTVAVNAFKAWCHSIAEHHRAALQLSAEVGASREQLVLSENSGEFLAFIFDYEADIPSYFSRWKANTNYYIPKRSTVPGREICEKISALPKMISESDYIRSIGFNGGLISGFRLMLFPPTTRVGETLYFSVPDDLPYTPPAHVVEILGTEYKQATNSIKSGDAQHD